MNEGPSTDLATPASIAGAVAVLAFLGAWSVAVLIFGVRLATGRLKIRSEGLLHLMRLHRQIMGGWFQSSNGNPDDDAMVRSMGMWLASGGLTSIVVIVVIVVAIVAISLGRG